MSRAAVALDAVRVFVSVRVNVGVSVLMCCLIVCVSSTPELPLSALLRLTLC